MAADTCNGKLIYSKGEAERARKWWGKSKDKAMRIYQCNKCFKWHLTKRDVDYKHRI